MGDIQAMMEDVMNVIHNFFISLPKEDRRDAHWQCMAFVFDVYGFIGDTYPMWLCYVVAGYMRDHGYSGDE
jgi:hypothetical protein